MYDTMCSCTQLGSRLDISVPKSYLAASYDEKSSQKAKEVLHICLRPQKFLSQHKPCAFKVTYYQRVHDSLHQLRSCSHSMKTVVHFKNYSDPLSEINHFAYFVKMWLLHQVAFVAEHRIGLTVPKLLSKCDQYTSLFWSHETLVICLNPNAYNFRPAVQNNDTLYM